MDVMTRVPVREQDPQVRAANFEEVCLGYNAEEAMAEAARCLNCKNAQCMKGCPVSINIPAFIAQVKEGNFEEAYHIISESSALPAVCGRVCPQENQCEGKCIRGIKGEAVAIGKLERFVADWAREHGIKPKKAEKLNGHKVAVIGSGPAGLTCAGDLAKLGYDVTIFEALHEAGFKTVSLQQLYNYVHFGTELPGKPIVLTFDDGYFSNYEYAFPILQEYDMQATIFAIGVSVGKDTYKDTGLAMVPHFSWEEAKEMVESGLVSIQSHTYDMHQWEVFETAGGGQCLRPNILRQPWETLGEYMQALREDVERSRQDIVEGTGQEAVALAYPGGLHDQISEELLRSYGVKCTFTIEGGKAQVTPGSERSLYGLNRFYVKPTTTDEEFLQWVG